MGCRAGARHPIKKDNMDKTELRKEIRDIKRQFTAQELHELSFAVIQRLLSHPRLHEAHTILLYYSLPDEVDTHTIVDSLLLSGKIILLPRVTGKSTMELRRYTGPRDLAKGAYNIMEPTGKVFTDYESISIAVIPGMAFDPSGNRMGRGKGYYDRLLTSLGHTYKIGVCFPFQMIESVPCDEYDVRMDEVIH